MKIYTRIKLQWDGTRYVLENSESFEYSGPVAKACGATGAQKTIQAQQQSFFGNAQQQAQQLFGNDSQVFGDLMKTFAPTVAAGPSQEGFSPGELSNLNSTAITATGQAYKNAKSAVGNAEAAQGGGISQLPGGAQVGADVGLAESAANQTATQLSGIKQADYTQGNANYDKAVAGLAGAPNVFNSSTGATDAAINAGTAASSSANQVAQENQSWVQSVTGALGGVAGAAASKIPFSSGGGTTGPGQAGLTYAQNLSNYGSSGLTPTNPDLYGVNV